MLGIDKMKDLWKLKKMQDDLKKQMEKIFIEHEERGIKMLIRGDKHVEKIEIDGNEDKRLKDVLNNAYKELDKKLAKKLQGQLGDFGIPGLS